MNNLAAKDVSLAPLGAGDLIDRAVRFYRKNFWTFVWIAVSPIIIGTPLGSRLPEKFTQR